MLTFVGRSVRKGWPSASSRRSFSGILPALLNSYKDSVSAVYPCLGAGFWGLGVQAFAQRSHELTSFLPLLAHQGDPDSKVLNPKPWGFRVF